jgi:thioredoxin 1
MVLTDKTFSEVVAKNEIVVVDFWAQWCEPCKSFAKVMEKLAEKYPDIIFASVDIDQEKELTRDFKIISVPSIMILKKQVVIFADSGALPATALSELIDKAKELDVSQL